MTDMLVTTWRRWTTLEWESLAYQSNPLAFCSSLLYCDIGIHDSLRIFCSRVLNKNNIYKNLIKLSKVNFYLYFEILNRERSIKKRNYERKEKRLWLSTWAGHLTTFLLVCDKLLPNENYQSHVTKLHP